jgi:hypothetical protein
MVSSCERHVNFRPASHAGCRIRPLSLHGSDRGQEPKPPCGGVLDDRKTYLDTLELASLADDLKPFQTAA